MFLGQYAHSLDDKSRLTMPAKFRAVLNGGVVVTRGIDRCLWVFPMEKWSELASKIDNLPLTSKDSRSFTRLMFSSAVDVQLDRQGRIRLPEYLLSYAEIDGEAIVAGANTRIEVWSKKLWGTINADVEDNPESFTEHLSGLL